VVEGFSKGWSHSHLQPTPSATAPPFPCFSNAPCAHPLVFCPWCPCTPYHARGRSAICGQSLMVWAQASCPHVHRFHSSAFHPSFPPPPPPLTLPFFHPSTTFRFPLRCTSPSEHCFQDKKYAEISVKKLFPGWGGGGGGGMQLGPPWQLSPHHLPSPSRSHTRPTLSPHPFRT
jgi:hypothetical protein